MSKFKIFIWILILAFIGVVLYQNKALFFANQTLGFDLHIVKYETPQLPVAIFFLATLVIGFMISYLFGLSDKFKTKKSVKSLNSTLDAKREEVTSLKREMELLKNRPAEASPAVLTDPSKTDSQPAIPPEKGQIASGDIGRTPAQPDRKEIPRMAAVRGESRQETDKKDSGEKEGEIKK